MESVQLRHRLVATVANHHLASQRALTLQMVTITIVINTITIVKITEVGLRKDPYAIPSKLGRQRLTRFQMWHGIPSKLGRQRLTRFQYGME